MRKFFFAMFVMALSIIGSMDAWAAETDYPKSTIQLIVPFKPGGDTDAYARIMGKYVEKYLGASCVVVNVAGSGGAVGSQQVMESNPDGYSLVFSPSTNVILNHMMGIVGYTYEDFETIGIPLMDKSNLLVGAKKFVGKTWPDIVDDIRAKPEEYVIGTEVGSLGLVGPLALQRAADVEFHMVDAGNMAERVTMMLGGQLDFFFGPYGSVMGYLKSGDMAALAMFSDERHSELPGVPAFEELGYTNISFPKGFFLGAPPKTDAAIVEKLRKALQDICRDEGFIKDMAAYFIVPKYMGPDDTKKHMDEMTALFTMFADEFLN